MDEISLQFVQIFDALRQPDNNIIAEATTAAQQLLKNPESINGLIQIILNPQFAIYKSHAAVFFGMYIKMHLNEIEDTNSIIQQVLQILTNETNYEMQRLFICSIEQIIGSRSAPMIFEFMENALQSQQDHLINASILLCIAIDIELDKYVDHYPFFTNLISVGLQKLPPANPIEFGFLLGNLYTGENIAFFLQLWNNSIDIVCQNLSDINNIDINLIKFITGELNSAMDQANFAAPYANPEPIMARFFPLLGNPEYGIEVNSYLLSSICYALDLEVVLDSINPEEFFPLLLQKLFQISAMAYNPEDQLAISYIDVFEGVCYLFSGSGGDLCDSFVETVLSVINDYYSQPQTRPGILIVLGYVIGGEGPSDIIVDSLPQISQLLIESVNDQTRLVRDSAAFAIKELSISVEDEIEDYFEGLAKAVLQSLEKEITQDMLSAFSNLLASAMDTDPIFDQSYNFLMQKMSSSHEVWLQHYFPCLKELCVHSQRKIKNVFQQLVPLLFSIIEKGDSENMAEQAVICLTSLSATVPEHFSQYIQQLTGILIQYLKSQNESLIIDSLNSFGKLMENHYEALYPALPQLTPILLEIGANDTRPNLIQEINNFKQKQLEELEQTGELEFNIGEEDDNDEGHFSPYAIPSLALSVFSSIARHYPQILPDTIQRVMNEFNIQIKNLAEDAIEENCRAISQISPGISKSQLSPEVKNSVASQFCKWMIDFINDLEDMDLVNEAIQTAEQIIDFLGVGLIGESNQLELINIIKKVLSGELKCQKGSTEYNKGFHDNFCTLVCQMVASYGQNAPTALGPIIPVFFNLATSKKAPYREIAIQVLGCFVQHSSENLPKNDKQNIYQFVINGIRKNSQHAAFALSQFTNNDGDIIMQSIDPLMKLIYEKLSQNKKKAASYVAFIDNLVAAVGEVGRNVLKEQFPMQQFAPVCLCAMPAKVDPTVNLEMMYFYVWMAKVLELQPVNEFAAVAIKLFMVPKSEIGGIAEDDSNILQNVASILVNCLNLMGPNAAEFVSTICENDPYKIQRVQEAINPVQ